MSLHHRSNGSFLLLVSREQGPHSRLRRCRLICPSPGSAGDFIHPVGVRRGGACVVWLARCVRRRSSSLCSGRGCRAVSGCPRPMGHRTSQRSCLRATSSVFGSVPSVAIVPPLSGRPVARCQALGESVVHVGSRPMRAGCFVQRATRQDRASVACWRRLHPPWQRVQEGSKSVVK